jgi:hypothetical protein
MNHIVLTINDIYILANIVIANSMWMDLLPWCCTTQRFVTFNVIQAKEMSYHNQHFIKQFFLLTIEIYGGLHKHVDVFLHDCANAI